MGGHGGPPGHASGPCRAGWGGPGTCRDSAPAGTSAASSLARGTPPRRCTPRTRCRWQWHRRRRPAADQPFRGGGQVENGGGPGSFQPLRSKEPSDCAQSSACRTWNSSGARSSGRVVLRVRAARRLRAATENGRTTAPIATHAGTGRWGATVDESTGGEARTMTRGCTRGAAWRVDRIGGRAQVVGGLITLSELIVTNSDLRP
jgi:hypothetical protein